MTNKYHNLSDIQIANNVAHAEAMIATYTEERKALLAELGKRLDSHIKSAYEGASKSHGKVTLRPYDAAKYTVEVDTRQTVKWDQEKLRAAGDAMDPEFAKRLIGVELSVSETLYNGLLPGPEKKALTDARTTKLSAPSIKVVFPKEKS